MTKITFSVIAAFQNLFLYIVMVNDQDNQTVSM